MSKATITVEGMVSKDPELRTAAGKSVVTVDVPHTPRKKDGDRWIDAGDTIWFQAAFWEQDAEAIAATVRKGTIVTVTGFPELNVYKRQDGTPGVTVRIKGGTLGVIPKQAQQSAPAAVQQPNNAWSTPGSQFDDESPF